MGKAEQPYKGVKMNEKASINSIYSYLSTPIAGIATVCIPDEV